MHIFENCQLTYSLDINLYPNPIDVEINYQFELKRAAHLIVEVFDLFGKVAYTNELDADIGNHMLKLDLSEFPKGMYIFKLNDGINQVSKRITKQ